MYEFLNFILDKHHDGLPEDEKGEYDPLWQKDQIEPLGNGCERNEVIDK